LFQAVFKEHIPKNKRQKNKPKTRNSAPSIKRVSLNALRSSGAISEATGKPETTNMAMNAINDKYADQTIPQRPRQGLQDPAKSKTRQSNQRKALNVRHRSKNTAAHASLPKITMSKNTSKNEILTAQQTPVRLAPDRFYTLRDSAPPISAAQRAFITLSNLVIK
jgi:hypothetical protein